MAVVNEVVTKFSFEGDLSPMETFNDNLTSSIGLLGAFGTAVVGATGALARMVSGQLEGLDPLVQLREETAMTAEEIQRLGFLATATGSDTDTMNATLRGLSQTIGQAAQEGSEEFSRLGIEVRKADGTLRDTSDVLFDVRDRFQELGQLSRREQLNFAESLGIDPSLIRLLNTTDSELANLNRRAEEQLFLTDEQVDSADRYNRALEINRMQIGNIRNMIAVSFAPQMEELADTFSRLLKENRDWIVEGLTAAGEMLSVLASSIIRLTPIFAALTAAFVASKIAALGLSGALGILLSPVVLITAGIAAALLIIDDLIVAFQGGESAIAKFMEQALGIDIQPFLIDMVESVKFLAQSFFDAGEEIFSFLKGVFQGLALLLEGDFEGAVKMIMGAFQGLNDWLLGLFGRLFGFLADQAMKILPDWAVDLIQGTGDAVSTLVPGNSGSTITEEFGGQPRIAPGPPSMQPGNIEQQVNIQVNSQDPERAGRSAADNVQRQLDTARTLSGRGGM